MIQKEGKLPASDLFVLKLFCVCVTAIEGLLAIYTIQKTGI